MERRTFAWTSKGVGRDLVGLVVGSAHVGVPVGRKLAHDRTALPRLPFRVGRGELLADLFHAALDLRPLESHLSTQRLVKAWSVPDESIEPR
jgi:hypothetical protein